MADHQMSRPEAAALLGVRSDAAPADVHRAFRMWARVAHPDAGGDPMHFARLTQARHSLLRAHVPAAQRNAAMPAARETSSRDIDEPSPRAPLAAMVRLPRLWPVLAVGAGMVVALALLPMLGIGVPLAALIAGLAAAAWSVLATRAALRNEADAGHRICLNALTWLPLVVLVVGVSWLCDTGFVTMLPLLALPLAAVVAWQNAGAGLWRPIGR